jgi:imidazolonepropionase-like amidohydrolase
MRARTGILAGLLLFGVAAAAPLAARQGAPAAARVTLIRAGRVLDVKAGRYLADQGILVEGGRIKQLGAFAAVRAAAPGDVVLIDLGKATVLPGLIDCHAHLLAAMDPSINGADELILTIAKYSPAKRVLLGAAMAREDLAAGFTAARVVGHSGIDGDVVLRDGIRNDWVPGPRLVASARKITPAGGQAIPVQSAVLPAILDQEYFAASSPEEGRRAVLENLRAGADFIKVVVDEWPRVLDDDTLKAIVAEAHRAARRVAAHATTRLGIQVAIDAGVDSIEHADEATEQQFQAMRGKGIVLVPTLWPRDLLVVTLTTTNPPPGALHVDPGALASIKDAIVAGGRAKLELARKVGVKIAFGSDMWFGYPDKTRGEATRLLLEALQGFGMPPAEALRAATSEAAELLNVGHLTGSLEAGRYADLIALDGDPLVDLRDLEKISFVMKGGVVVRDDAHAGGAGGPGGRPPGAP